MILHRMMNIIISSMFVLLLRRTAGYQNADLTVEPSQLVLGDFILMTCGYTGPGNVSAISWFNGSNLDALILTPESKPPQCDVFLTINTSYDPSRISYTCDVAQKSYTLKIHPLRDVDQNVKWSCTFQDPLPCPKMAEYTINLTDKNHSTLPEEDKLSLFVYLLPALGVLVVLIITLISLYRYKYGIKKLRRHAASTHETVLYLEAKVDIIHKQEVGNEIQAGDLSADCAHVLLCESSQDNVSQEQKASLY